MKLRKPILQRRGAAAIVMVVLLIVVAIIVIGSTITGARDQDLSVRRIETIQAFYAAEGGMNMAIRELMNNDDEDGDGAIGTISDDGNDANNPSVGAAKVLVTSDESGGVTTLTSAGSSGAATREIESELTGSAGGVFQESGGMVVMEAENFNSTAAGTGSMSAMSWVQRSTITGASGGLYLDSNTNSGVNPGDSTDGPRLDYRVNFTTTGTYYLWVRTYCPSTSDDSVHAGITTPATYGDTGLGYCCNAWGWASTVVGRVTVNVPTAGQYTVSVWMREDGTKFDKLLLTTSSGYTPSGTGPAESTTN